MKLASGRPRDLLDVKEIQRAALYAPSAGQGSGKMSGKRTGKGREEEKAEYVRPLNGAPARRGPVFPIPGRPVNHDTGIPGKNPTSRYIVSREKEHTGMEAVFVVFEGPNRRFGFPPLLCGLYTCLCVKAGPLA